MQINTSFSAVRVSKAAVRASVQHWLSAQSLCHFSQELACPAFSLRQAHQDPLSNRQGKYSASLLFNNSLLNYSAASPPQVPLKHLLCAETLPSRHLSAPQACCVCLLPLNGLWRAFGHFRPCIGLMYLLMDGMTH